MSEYWVISAPGDKTCQQTWDTLNNATKSGNLSVNYKFPIPDLKVSSLPLTNYLNHLNSQSYLSSISILF